VANYHQAIGLVFDSETIDAGNLTPSLLAKLVLKDSACWHNLSSLFSTKELELLFKDLYCLEIWNLLLADRISSQELAECLFNNALINDPPKIIITLQKVLGLSPTGTMDLNTLACLQSISVDYLIEQLEQLLLKNSTYFPKVARGYLSVDHH